MSPRRAEHIAPDATVSRFDTAIEWLLVALLAFMPLAFGAVEAWSEFVVVLLAAAVALCLAAKLVVRREERVVWTWAYVPLVLFLLVAALQLLPLPREAVRAVSPHTEAVKADLLGDLPDAQQRLDAMTLSFYPLATRHDLRLALVAAVVFVAVVNVVRRTDQVKRLLAAIAVIGGGVALLALAQDLFGNGKIYWVVPTVGGKDYSGTFICHSHYGQFMNLSIGAALGLLLLKLHESFSHGPVRLPDVVERLGDARCRPVWCLAAVIVLGAATLFVSLTRGGMVALLIAGGFTALVLASRRALQGRGWLMMVLALGAFTAVLYLGFDAVYDRLATLREMHAYKGRWQIVQDVASAWTRFPALGTGLGTHQVVYPMFDRATVPALAAHAENEYAQLAEETGIVGLALLLAFLAVVWHRYVHNVRHLRLPVRSAAFGLGFGLLAVMIHSLSDFGQHLPANFCLSAVSCGLLVGIARMGRLRAHRPRWWRPLTRLQPLRVAAALAVAAVAAWSLLGAHRARCAEARWRSALRIEHQLRENDWLGSNDQYAALIRHADDAVRCQPDNVHYRHWLAVYRWRSISRVTDPGTGNVVITPRTLEFTRRIVTDLHQARALCPTFGPTYCVVGQLEKFILERPQGADHIRTGYALAPHDPTACFVAGQLDAAEGRADESLAKLRRCVALNGRFFPEIAELYVRQVDRPDLAVQLASENTGRLLRVARLIQETGDNQPLASQAKAQAVQLLKARSQEPDAPAATLAAMARIWSQEGDREAAIQCYRKALALDYGQAAWRLALARLLADTGRVPEAIHQARVCLRLRPEMDAARKLIADLSLEPAALTEK
ncbi:MAG: O-antigen ligase family protein [bacterium]